MNTILAKLLEGNHLSQPETKELLYSVFNGDVSDVEIAAMLAAFNCKGIQYTEIAGAAQAMMAHAELLPLPTSFKCSDSCGTGGDGLKTLNISTLAALTCAAAGVKVAKHGNRSVSSQCGSADILEALGLPLNLDPKVAAQALEKTNFCFLFAPQYHQAVRNVMPVRKALKVRTLFNLLGPIVNPAHPKTQLMGVYDPEKCLDVAKALQLVGVEKAMVVNGEGMDEFTIDGETQVAFLNKGNISSLTITPEDFGFERHSVEDIQISDVEDALSRTRAFLSGNGRAAEIASVAINAGALIYLNNKAKTLAEGASIAKRAIESGDLLKVIEQYKQFASDVEQA